MIQKKQFNRRMVVMLEWLIVTCLIIWVRMCDDLPMQQLVGVKKKGIVRNQPQKRDQEQDPGYPGRYSF